MLKRNSFLALKILIALFVIAGLILNFVYAKEDGYSSASARLLYFTNQSNIWIGAMALLFVSLEIFERRKGKSVSWRWLYPMKLAFVVSITLTGVVFCALLAPHAGEDYRAWTVGSVFVHAVVPALSIIDFLFDTSSFRYEKKHNFFSLIPPFYYFLFSLVLYLCNVDFGRGDPFPYFFLNFGSPAGIFGFSDVFPYKMGSFYWVVLLSLFVFSVSLLYSFLYNKIRSLSLKKQIEE